MPGSHNSHTADCSLLEAPAQNGGPKVVGSLEAMRRIVDLLSEICAAGPAMTLRATADVALAALSRQFPGSGAALLECDTRPPQAVHVITGVQVPSEWRAGRVPLADMPTVAEALRAPDRVVQGVALLCGVIPAHDDASYVVALFGGDVSGDIPTGVERCRGRAQDARMDRGSCSVRLAARPGVGGDRRGKTGMGAHGRCVAGARRPG